MLDFQTEKISFFCAKVLTFGKMVLYLCITNNEIKHNQKSNKMEKSVFETAKSLNVTKKYAFGAMTYDGMFVWELVRMKDDAILGCWNRDNVSYLEALGLLFQLGINHTEIAFV